MEAAEAVGAGSGIEEGEVLELLSHLVDKSLVIVEASREEGVSLRYRMLEPVRQFGLEQLEESGEAERVQERHSGYYLALAEEAESELRGPEQVVWLERLETEHPNLRAALSWALDRRTAESGERAELGLRLAATLWRFWDSHGHPSEGRRWLDRGLSESNAPSAARAEALTGIGWIMLFQGDYELAITRLEESLALFGELGDERDIASALTNYWCDYPGEDRS